MSTENPPVKNPPVKSPSVKSKKLISVICRTVGRAELQQALQSVAAQSYPNIEIVLVDALGTDSLNYKSAADNVPVNLLSTGHLLGRSQAANAGLEAAKGKYIQFLDDDDWIDAAHLTQLADFLDSNKEFQAVYSSTQKTTAAGEPIDYVFREDYDPILLMRDNYIPIHSILFESALLKQGCRFDEAFDIYEDWDFWLQLSQHTAFHHIDSLTAFYREGGDSDTTVADVRLRYQDDNILSKGRAALFDKWLPKWNGERINSLIGQLDQSVLLCEQDVKIHSGLQKNAELQHQIAQRNMQITELTQQIVELTQQMQQRNMQIADLTLQRQKQARHTTLLETTLDTIYQSKSWKLMGPVRRIARALSSTATTNTDTPDSDK